MKVKDIFFNKVLLSVVNGVLALVVFFLLLIIARDIFSSTDRGMVEDAVSQQEKGAHDGMKKFEEYAVILDKNPFGFDAGELTALSSYKEKKEKPVGDINLKLVGTIAAGDKDSFAIFLDSKGEQVLYRVGSDIPGRGVLEKVAEDRVFIRGDDVVEVELQQLERDAGSAKTPWANGRGASNRGASSAGPDDEFVRKAGKGVYELNGKMVQESINNPQRLMTDARLQPRYKDGKQEGFVLRAVKRGGLYESLGLQNGDVLLRVNEYDITNPESALQAFTALKGVSRLQLDIVRNNEPVTFTYHIK